MSDHSFPSLSDIFGQRGLSNEAGQAGAIEASQSNIDTLPADYQARYTALDFAIRISHDGVLTRAKDYLAFLVARNPLDLPDGN